MGPGSIEVPFSIEEAADPTIDLVVDRDYTPDTKGLAFRMFFVNYLGEPGVKVDLTGAEAQASGSPADKLQHFVFGLYPSGYDFWSNRGTPIAEIRKNWKPNFRPDYPTDDVGLCPFCFEGVARGKYHEFMTTYGGCNVAGNGATAEMFQGNPYLRGALSSSKNPADARRILAIDPRHESTLLPLLSPGFPTATLCQPDDRPLIERLHHEADFPVDSRGSLCRGRSRFGPGQPAAAGEFRKPQREHGMGRGIQYSE